MKILVTGGAGFIGSHTCVALINSGITPVVVDNFSNSNKKNLKGIEKITGEKIIFYKLDCRDYNALTDVFQKEKKIEGAIHFAAFKSVEESHRFPEKYFKNNVDSTKTLLRVLQKQNVVNLVFSSSCTVYGKPSALPVTEQMPIKKTESPYGETKQICELLIEAESNNSLFFKSCILRYFNPIGAHLTGLIGERLLGAPNNLVPYITETAAQIRKEVIVFGDTYDTRDGTCIRDYIHVMDLAEAHVCALKWLYNNKKSTNEVFNIGTGKGVSVLEIVKKFETVNNIQLNYKIGKKRQGDIDKIYASTKKANKTLNWQAKRTIKQALKDAWRFQKTL